MTTHQIARSDYFFPILIWLFFSHSIIFVTITWSRTFDKNNIVVRFGNWFFKRLNWLVFWLFSRRNVNVNIFCYQFVLWWFIARCSINGWWWIIEFDILRICKWKLGEIRFWRRKIINNCRFAKHQRNACWYDYAQLKMHFFRMSRYAIST